MCQYAGGWPLRVRAVEGANGVGRPLAQRLLEAGVKVVDVAAKLAARSQRLVERRDALPAPGFRPSPGAKPYWRSSYLDRPRRTSFIHWWGCKGSVDG
jgi:hypothetical protein